MDLALSSVGGLLCLSYHSDLTFHIAIMELLELEVDHMLIYELETVEHCTKPELPEPSQSAV